MLLQAPWASYRQVIGSSSEYPERAWLRYARIIIQKYLDSAALFRKYGKGKMLFYHFIQKS